MAVVHFPTTTSEYLSWPDPNTDHESEDAVLPKYIAQQFIWSQPRDEVLSFFGKAASRGTFDRQLAETLESETTKMFAEESVASGSGGSTTDTMRALSLD